MINKTAPTPKEREARALHARGKTPDQIAVRLNVKVSKVLAMLALIPKPAV